MASAGALGTQWNYVTTAQKPTVVTHSTVGNFTGQDDYNLILAYVPDFRILLNFTFQENSRGWE